MNFRKNLKEESFKEIRVKQVPIGEKDKAKNIGGVYILKLDFKKKLNHNSLGNLTKDFISGFLL